MALVAKVFRRRKLYVNALCLKDHPDVAPQSVGIGGYVVAENERPAGARDHKGGENPEQGGLAAAVRTQQAEQLGGRTSNETPLSAVRFS